MKYNTARPFDWTNILFLTLSPLIAVVWGTWYIAHYGVHPAEVALFVVMYVATGMSITGGYHRYFSHVCYKANTFMKAFYLLFGACAMQNSAMHWSADHRLHHRFTDTDSDPYNAGRGFWWSHMAWIFYESPRNRDFSLVKDLQDDPWVRWQHKHHVKVAILLGFVMPFLLGLWIGRPFGMLLWGGLIRVVVVHHATFLINSLAHMWGNQPYSRSDSSRNSWWLAFLTYGEGYHNFHHKFPSDYRNGIRWYQWDPTKWLIRGLNMVGFATKLHRVPDYLILRSRVEVEALDAEKRLQVVPSSVASSFRERLLQTRIRMEKALHEWGDSVAHYRDAKKAHWPNRAEVLASCRAKIHQYEAKLEEARIEWQAFLKIVRQTPRTEA